MKAELAQKLIGMISSLKRNKKAIQTHLTPILPPQLKQYKDALLLSPLPTPFICIWLSVPLAPGLRKPGRTKAASGGEGVKETPSASALGGSPWCQEPPTCQALPSLGRESQQLLMSLSPPRCWVIFFQLMGTQSSENPNITSGSDRPFPEAVYLKDHV